jgi:hypothetical protein
MFVAFSGLRLALASAAWTPDPPLIEKYDHRSEPQQPESDIRNVPLYVGGDEGDETDTK